MGKNVKKIKLDNGNYFYENIKKENHGQYVFIVSGYFSIQRNKNNEYNGIMVEVRNYET